MSLRISLAAVLRALRLQKRLSQESMPEGTTRQYLGRLESAKSSVSLEKLDELSDSHKLSPATVVAASILVRDNLSPEEITHRIGVELQALYESGGLTLAREQIKDGNLVSKQPGRSVDVTQSQQIQDCKAKGMTQQQTATALGLHKVTVHRYWN